jgi:hypothetical protein
MKRRSNIELWEEGELGQLRGLEMISYNTICNTGTVNAAQVRPCHRLPQQWQCRSDRKAEGRSTMRGERAAIWVSVTDDLPACLR